MRFTPMPHPNRAPAWQVFADISSNNPTFDARHYASAGHLLIMIKATEGTGFVTPLHGVWSDAAHAARLAVAHYHFCDPGLGDPVGEARHCWDTARPHFRPHVDRLVIDLETGDERTWPAYLAALDNELHRYTGGLEPALYTFASALTPQLRVRSGHVHVAAWGSHQPSGPFRRLVNGHLWAWQYTNGVIDPSGGPREFAGIGQADGSLINPVTLHRIRKALGR